MAIRSAIKWQCSVYLKSAITIINFKNNRWELENLLKAKIILFVRIGYIYKSSTRIIWYKIIELVLMRCVCLEYEINEISCMSWMCVKEVIRRRIAENKKKCHIM